MKKLDPVLSLLGVEAKESVSINGIAYDSRKVKPGYAFFCIPGEHVDGNEFIGQAVENGAACIFTEKKVEAPISVPYFLVKDVRLAQALVADSFFDYPSKKLRLLAVTGTNGKTTTTHLIEHIFNSCGKTCGLIGTLGNRYPGLESYSTSKHTTPQAADLHEILAQMQERGCSYIAMEVSSHALEQHRVGGCRFASAGFTNLTQDHLDFHKTMDNYASAKVKLFEMLSSSEKEKKAAIINIDDEYGAKFAKACDASVKVITYGFKENADIQVVSAKASSAGTELCLKTPWGAINTTVKLVGRFNLYNVMASCGFALNEGISPNQLNEALRSFAGVAGRFEVVSDKEEPLCIVDYAHTPDGLENVLKTARDLVPKEGKLRVVFGCGGDRDASKRPQMGHLAETYADEVIVTSDNPRTENPQQIIANILAGIKRMRNVKVEPDRASAIRLAVSGATKHDVIVVAGKGHENYQILGDRTIPFDDRIEVQSALKESCLQSR